MDIVANIIIYIYNITGNFGVAIIIVSFISTLLSLLANYFNLNNQYIKNKYAKDVYIIKKDFENPEEQLEKINLLYKQDNYQYIIPVLLKIVVSIINIIIFIVILNYTKYIKIDNINPSFLFIDDIFMPTIDIKIPILCASISFICENIFCYKQLFKKENLKQTLSSIFIAIISIITFTMYGNFFGQVYLIYILGISIFKIIPMLLFKQKKIEIFKLNKEYQEWLEKKQ